MPFNLLLLPLLGGFIFFSHWSRTAFFAKRQDRERLLLYSSLWGIVFLGLSFLLSIVMPYVGLLAALRRWWAYNTPPIQFSGISSCALLVGVVGPTVLNKLSLFSGAWTRKRAGKSAVERYGTQLERLLYRCLAAEKRVMLTLKNGKVYVGRVARVTPKEDTDLLLLPSKSGYRDGQQRLILTIDYDQTYANIAETEENYLNIINEFGVVIPIPEILTANLYNADVQDKYFTYQPPPPSKQDRRKLTRRK